MLCVAETTVAIKRDDSRHMTLDRVVYLGRTAFVDLFTAEVVC